MRLKRNLTALLAIVLVMPVLPPRLLFALSGHENPPQYRNSSNETSHHWKMVRQLEPVDKLRMPPPPRAVLEIQDVRFNPKWIKLEVGVPIGIYVSFMNSGPPGSITTDFRIYLSQNGKVLQKGHPSSNKLRAGWASYTNFQITLPNTPGRHCWEVSLRQTDEGRMTLGDPREICALLKTKATSGLPLKRH